MYFDRFDVCEAFLALEWDYNVSGLLQELPSTHRERVWGGRRYTAASVGSRLDRIKFKPSPRFRGYESLSENGREIYHKWVAKLKLPVSQEITECRQRFRNGG